MLTRTSSSSRRTTYPTLIRTAPRRQERGGRRAANRRIERVDQPARASSSWPTSAIDGSPENTPESPSSAAQQLEQGAHLVTIGLPVPISRVAPQDREVHVLGVAARLDAELVQHGHPQRLIGLQRPGTLPARVQAAHQLAHRRLGAVGAPGGLTGQPDRQRGLVALVGRLRSPGAGPRQQLVEGLPRRGRPTGVRLVREQLPRHRVQGQRHVRHVPRQQAPHRGHVDPDVLGIQQVAVVRGGERATPTRHQPEPAPQRAHVALDGGDVARRRPPVPQPLGEQVLGDRRPQVQREHLEDLTRLAAT